jgi:ribonuclease P protein component
VRERLRPSERIRRRSEFQRVYDQGIRASGRLLTLVVLPNVHGVSRLGIVATRKLGGAARRNRAKRLVREVFRRAKPAGALDVVVVLRPEAAEASLEALGADYQAALERCRARLRARAAPSACPGGC